MYGGRRRSAGSLPRTATKMPDTLKTNVFLILAISLGLRIDIRDLYPPNNKSVIFLILSVSFTHWMVATH